MLTPGDLPEQYYRDDFVLRVKRPQFVARPGSSRCGNAEDRPPAEVTV